MAKKNINEVLKQDTATVADQYLQKQVGQDMYTRTHRAPRNYKVVDNKGDLFLYPIETDGRGNMKIMKKAPEACTDGSQIHFVVNTVKDSYNNAFIRTENRKGKDKGKQAIEACVAFQEAGFIFGADNVRSANNKKDVFALVGSETDDNKKVVQSNETYAEDVSAEFPASPLRKTVKGVDSGDGQRDTLEPSVPKNDAITAKPTTADITAE
ncbi:putative Ig-like protein [Staphylococcus phage vB_SauH_DELF3]|nr:putative Ig-like protein [Staphylococcus phage vB_SauH_DELF3]